MSACLCLGCKNAGAKDLRPSDCLACRVAKDPVTNVCLEKCPENAQPDEKKECLRKSLRVFSR